MNKILKTFDNGIKLLEMTKEEKQVKEPLWLIVEEIYELPNVFSIKYAGPIWEIFTTKGHSVMEDDKFYWIQGYSNSKKRTHFFDRIQFTSCKKSYRYKIFSKKENFEKWKEIVINTMYMYEDGTRVLKMNKEEEHKKQKWIVVCNNFRKILFHGKFDYIKQYKRSVDNEIYYLNDVWKEGKVIFTFSSCVLSRDWKIFVNKEKYQEFLTNAINKYKFFKVF